MAQVKVVTRDSPKAARDPFAQRRGDVSSMSESGRRSGRLIVGAVWNAAKGEFDQAPANTRWDAPLGKRETDGLPDLWIFDLPGTVAEVQAQLAAIFGKRVDFRDPQVNPNKLDRRGRPMRSGRSAWMVNVEKLDAAKTADLLADGRVALDVVEFAAIIEGRADVNG